MLTYLHHQCVVAETINTMK